MEKSLNIQVEQLNWAASDALKNLFTTELDISSCLQATMQSLAMQNEEIEKSIISKRQAIDRNSDAQHVRIDSTSTYESDTPRRHEKRASTASTRLRDIYIDIDEANLKHDRRSGQAAAVVRREMSTQTEAMYVPEPICKPELGQGPASVHDMSLQVFLEDEETPLEQEYINSLEEQLLDLRGILKKYKAAETEREAQRSANQSAYMEELQSVQNESINFELELQEAANDAANRLYTDFQDRIDLLLYELGDQKDYNTEMLKNYMVKQELMAEWENRLTEQQKNFDAQRSSTTPIHEEAQADNKEIETLNQKLNKAKEKLRRTGPKSQKSAQLIQKIRQLTQAIGATQLKGTVAQSAVVEKRLVAIEREWIGNEVNKAVISKENRRFRSFTPDFMLRSATPDSMKDFYPHRSATPDLMTDYYSDF